MNRLKIRNVMSMVAIAMATLISCVPEDGDTGPVGPIGPEGPPGADGSIGRDGEDGADGGSQVQAVTFSMPQADWNALALNISGTIFPFINDTIALAQITSDVQDNGAIQLFRSEDSGVTWTAIPYTFFSINHSFSYSTGELYLRADNSGNNITSLPDATYKVVIIPDVLRKKGFNYDELSLEQIETLHEVKEELFIPQ